GGSRSGVREWRSDAGLGRRARTRGADAGWVGWGRPCRSGCSARGASAQPQPQAPPQQPPPPAGAGAASVALARPPTATSGISLTVSAWPAGQVAGLPAPAIGRRSSNVSPQVRQRKSYSGTGAPRSPVTGV